MITRRDYTAEGVEAARSVLVELVHLLGEYKDEIEDPEEQERIQRNAYERVNALLKKLGIPV